MKLIVVFCILIGSICGFERKSEEYKKALFSISDEVKRSFNIEYGRFIDTGIKSQKLLSLISMLKPTKEIRKREIENLAVEDQATSCLLCHSVVSVALKYRREEDKDDAFMTQMLIELCHNLQIQTDEVCSGLITRNIPIILYIVDNTPSLTEQSICGIVLQGSNCAATDPEFEWAIDIDQTGKEITKPKVIIPVENSKDIKIVQISDVHFDPLYKTGGLAECEEPLCCRQIDDKQNDSTKLAGKWGDYRDCDVSWDMFENSVQHIANEHKNIDYIYFTGDIIDHGVWSTTHDGNRQSIKQINDQMKQTFPNTPIYPLIGNHETNPLNVFAPNYIEEEELTTNWLYEFLANEWADWLPKDALETVKIGGYYTVTPKSGFRIIALNNNDCYTFNFWLLLDPQYLSKQLQWLHDTLLAAEKSNEYVHILNHIPSGEGSCFNTWSREYRRIIDRFHNIIGGIFVGHTHFDEFNVYYSKTKPSHAINVAWNGGSLTPFSFVNSNYRVYYVEPETYQVVDHDTWIYNLTLANLNADQDPIWYKEYSFKDSYHLKDLSPASLDNLLDNFATDRDFLYSYWERKVKLGDPSLQKGCHNYCLAGHLCELATTQSNDVERCEELQKIFKETTFDPNSTTEDTSLATEPTDHTEDEKDSTTSENPPDKKDPANNSGSRKLINFKIMISILCLIYLKLII